MSSELIVMTFHQRENAITVINAIKAMRKSPILNLESSVLVKKDENGEITFLRTEKSAVAQEDYDALVLLSLAKLILGTPPEGAIDMLIEKGVDRRFVKEIVGIMEDESSTLFFLTRENSVHDADELRRTLALFKGKIHQTSLLPEAEAYLLKGGGFNGLMTPTEQRKEI